ncbi:zinc-binding dehydrogenase [Paenibacillus sacheonensis]|uniref:Zinc-binding dehydrogenase n=1 Tax=Paenibacillus sacheonensis TaxID=742054 RepID=A0A7X5BWX5_9BACL|nr:zinc-binding dehydrogenase [Paenibacillus sacheonensis]MBM7563882.1 NADPH:quinone reductase-like Zn-dependent oxidoreductase [Paenibacillus sacheonensis]NBC67771.1 zinc-binding dehydrogenase [Paenibacillus sacheonensis]
MRAIVLHAPGEPHTFALQELPIPEPGPGEIRVRIQAASLNPADYKMAKNGNPAWMYPFVPGLDAAGIVDKVGEGVTEWAEGDRVVYHGNFTKPGTFAEYGIVQARAAARIGDGLTYQEAAAFPCAGLTAYQALNRKMNVQAGSSILVHAGAGGVGGYAVQLAKAFGASPILATASTENFDYVKSLGADYVIDYNAENVHERVMALTEGRGVDCILNGVNRQTAQADLSMLSFGGQLACIAGAPETVADFQPSHKTFSVHKLMLSGAYLSGDERAVQDLSAMAEQFMALMAAGKVDPMIGKLIALEEIPQELTRLSQRHVRGKIVVDLERRI